MSNLIPTRGQTRGPVDLRCLFFCYWFIILMCYSQYTRLLGHNPSNTNFWRFLSNSVIIRIIHPLLRISLKSFRIIALFPFKSTLYQVVGNTPPFTQRKGRCPCIGQRMIPIDNTRYIVAIIIHSECSSAICPILVVIMIIGEQFAHCRQ